MAAGRIFEPTWMPARDSNGYPIPDARVFVFRNKTDELASIYSDEALTTPLDNPVEANSSGRYPAIWASDAQTYSLSFEPVRGKPGTPSTYDDFSVSVSAELIVVGAAEAAADAAEASAVQAEEALAEIEEIAAGSPDAPSIVNKLNLNAGNIGGNGATFRTNTGTANILTTEAVSTASLAEDAYEANAAVIVKSGEDVGLAMVAGDFTDQANWLAGQVTNETSDLHLAVPDGLTSVTSYADTTRNRVFRLRGSAAPDYLLITSVAFTALGGGDYTATITTSTALPARVVNGWALGFQHCTGSTGGVTNGMYALNGAHIVTGIAANRLSFDIAFSSEGVAIPSGTITGADIGGGTNYGISQNRVVVAQACIVANSAGWDGNAREGFLNALQGGKIELERIAIAYSGAIDEHDILFSGGVASSIYLKEVVIAGAGDKLLRSAYGGRFYAANCWLGGAQQAAEGYQGIALGKLSMLRCFIGDLSRAGFTASGAAEIYLNQCVIAGSLSGIYTAQPTSTITLNKCTIAYCTNAVENDAGVVHMDGLTEIRACTNIYATSGQAGRVFSSAVVSDCTNPIATDPNSGYRLAIKAASGDGVGGVVGTTASISGAATVGSIAVGSGGGVISKIFTGLSALTDLASIPAQGMATVDVPITGVLAADKSVVLVDWSGGVTSPGLILGGHVSGDGNVRVQVHNPTAAAIDPAGRTYRVLVFVYP